ncbi:MAG: hypothetical protein ACKVXR_15875 [Planctomycetota bacterium]
MAGARAQSGALRLAGLALALLACGCGNRGARAAVERHYAEKAADPARVSYGITEVDPWAEHAAFAHVREEYADGRVEDVLLEVVRDGGTWKVTPGDGSCR